MLQRLQLHFKCVLIVDQKFLFFLPFLLSSLSRSNELLKLELCLLDIRLALYGPLLDPLITGLAARADVLSKSSVHR